MKKEFYICDKCRKQIKKSRLRNISKLSLERQGLFKKNSLFFNCPYEICKECEKTLIKKINNKLFKIDGGFYYGK